MKTDHVVIIGFGAAGYAALSTIKRISPKTKITIIDPKDTDLFHPCGLPYALEGLFPPEDLRQNIPLDRMDIEKIRGTVTKINHESKEIIANINNKEISVPYDKVLMSTGTVPVTPSVNGIDSCSGGRLFNLTNESDCRMIMKKFQDSKTGAVIGAGAIGLESAVAFAKNLEKTYVIEMKDQVLPGVLDSDLASLVNEHLKSDYNIEIRTGTTLKEIHEKGDSVGLTLDNEAIDADIALMAAGFRPNLNLIDDSQIECSPYGIITKQSMETSINDIFAAGDCAAAKSIIDDKSLDVALATSAYKMGVVAGKNICGLGETYTGTAGTFVTHLGTLEIAGTGFNSIQAKERGFNPVSGKIKMGILPHYFPGNSEIAIKVLADKDSGKILGAQAVGQKGAAERINIISTAIEFDLSLPQVLRIELAYCPSVSEVHDPLFKAIEFLQRRLKKL